MIDGTQANKNKDVSSLSGRWKDACIFDLMPVVMEGDNSVGKDVPVLSS